MYIGRGGEVVHAESLFGLAVVSQDGVLRSTYESTYECVVRHAFR
jgi:hypothetical protein